MDRVFLDANVLYSAAYLPRSRLRRLWELHEAELWTCDRAAGEALANLAEDRPGQVPALQRLLARTRVAHTPDEPAGLPDDAHLPPSNGLILAAAVQADATHFLTGDRSHFGAWYGQRVAGILILPPADYLRSTA